MMEGIVQWFDDEKGIGFIQIEGGEEVFVHHSSIEMSGYRSLIQGDRVSFIIEKTNRGREAKNVKKVK
ncbi:MAG: cold shock domain-containing protein [Desulfobacteraceae bacterium]|jgi:CspA family cold shock protein